MATFRNQPMGNDTFKILRKLTKFFHFEIKIFENLFSTGKRKKFLIACFKNSQLYFYFWNLKPYLYYQEIYITLAGVSQWNKIVWMLVIS